MKLSSGALALGLANLPATLAWGSKCFHPIMKPFSR